MVLVENKDLRRVYQQTFNLFWKIKDYYCFPLILYYHLSCCWTCPCPPSVTLCRCLTSTRVPSRSCSSSTPSCLPSSPAWGCWRETAKCKRTRHHSWRVRPRNSQAVTEMLPKKLKPAINSFLFLPPHPAPNCSHITADVVPARWCSGGDKCLNMCLLPKKKKEKKIPCYHSYCKAQCLKRRRKGSDTFLKVRCVATVDTAPKKKKEKIAVSHSRTFRVVICRNLFAIVSRRLPRKRCDVAEIRVE